MNNCVTTQDISDIKIQISQNNTLANDQSEAIQSLQNKIIQQDKKLDEKWDIIKDFFNKQNIEMEIK